MKFNENIVRRHHKMMTTDTLPIAMNQATKNPTSKRMKKLLIDKQENRKR